MWCRNTESFWNCCFIGWIALRCKLHVWAAIAVTTATVAAVAATAAAAHFCNISDQSHLIFVMDSFHCLTARVFSHSLFYSLLLVLSIHSLATPFIVLMFLLSIQDVFNTKWECRRARKSIYIYAFKSIQTMLAISTLFSVHICNFFYVRSRAHCARPIGRKNTKHMQFMYSIECVLCSPMHATLWFSFTPSRLVRACRVGVSSLSSDSNFAIHCTVYTLYLVYYHHHTFLSTLFFAWTKLLCYFSSFPYG